jgi:hypothetical protein
MMKHYREHEKNIKLTIDEGPVYKSISLPSNMFALSDDLVLQIRYYLGHVRVQICRYFIDDDGFLHSTHDRISLNPYGWTALYKKLATFKKKDVILNLEPDVYIRYERSNNRGSYIFHHNYYANFVRLRESEFQNLKKLTNTINLQFLQILIQQKLLYFNMSNADLHHINNLKSVVFSPVPVPDFTQINELILHESRIHNPTMDYAEEQILFQSHFKSALIKKIHEQANGLLCFNDLLLSMDIVKIAFDFQLNSLSDVDWFKFYEKFNFCELLIELQEEFKFNNL